MTDKFNLQLLQNDLCSRTNDPLVLLPLATAKFADAVKCGYPMHTIN